MDQRIRIVFEDDVLIVCHKYPGIAVQTAALGQADMVSELKKYLAGQGGKNPYLAVVHRLDQPVEGLLVFAKTEAGVSFLFLAISSGVLRGSLKKKQVIIRLMRVTRAAP